MSLSSKQIDRLAYLSLVHVENFASFDDKMEVVKSLFYYEELQSLLIDNFAFSFADTQTLYEMCGYINNFFRGKDIGVYAEVINVMPNSNNACCLMYKGVRLFEITFNL